MKPKSRTASIHHSTDTNELKQQIRQLQDLGYRVVRPYVHQIKVGKYNWYWSTDRITIDPSDRHPERGFEAFLALIEKNVRKTRTPDWSGQEPVVLNFPIPSSFED